MKKISLFLFLLPVFPCHAQQMECLRVFQNGKTATTKNFKIPRFSGGLKRVKEPVPLERVKVPASLKREDHLRSQGVREYYTAGLDEVVKLRVLARALKSGVVDPENTHIVDFADQVENHIAFFNVGVWDPVHKNRDKPSHPLSSDPEEKQSGLWWSRQFEDLIRQARSRVKNKRLTYKFWVEFNYRLSALSQGTDFSEERTRHFGILKHFPDYVYLPTIKELGIMAFNHVDTHGIILIGLINRPVEVDGVLFYPEKFFHHDAVHYRYGTKKIHQVEKEFYKQWSHQVKTLSPTQREKVELVYFLMTHEERKPRPTQYSEDSYVTQEVLKSVKRFYKKEGCCRDMHHLLPSEVNAGLTSEIETWLRKSAQAFVKTARAAQI